MIVKKKLERLDQICPGCIVSDRTGKNIYLTTDDVIDDGSRKMSGLVALQNGLLTFYDHDSQVRVLDKAVYHLYEKKSRGQNTGRDSPLMSGTVFKMTDDPEPCIMASVTDNRSADTQVAFGIYSGQKRTVKGDKYVTVYPEAETVF